MVASIYLERAALRLPQQVLAEDGWQIYLLASLTIATKSYCDVPPPSSILLGPTSSIRAGWPTCTAVRLHTAERILLHALNHRTLVSSAEFAAMAFGDEA